MIIEMKCPVCNEGQKGFKVELPELEIEEDGEYRGITTIKFYCPHCGKEFRIGG